MGPSDDELEVELRRVTAESRFSGSVRVDRPGSSRTWAFGAADRRWQIPFSADTRAGIASATKFFTALVVMRLAEEGALGLDQPARSLLEDDLPLVDDRVTVEHLLAHRSGIGDYLDESASDVRDHVMPVPVHRLDATEAYVTVLDGHPQVSTPGARFRYNNSGYVVLALLAERAAGRRFEDLVVELVCRPAELSATGFERSDALPAGLAVGYLASEGLRTNVLHLPVLGSGDGGLSSTVDDLHRCWSAFFADAIVTASSRDLMLRARSATEHDRYGLGAWLDRSGTGVRMEGYDAGVSCWSAHHPTTGVTYSVIGNWTDAAWPTARTLRTLLAPQ